MRIALALSGGGFRATLFHLGVVRFLRDAGLLGRLTDITAVSGGSILAAHLALHWDEYLQDEESFEALAHDLISFTQRDIRGKILRRLPLRLFRRFSPSTLLDHYYSRFLYGDARLGDLTHTGPQLHILATNLTTGHACSFHRLGISREGTETSKKDVEASDFPLSLAVACSSAFTSLFPPISITADMLGAKRSRWAPDPQSFTDGGIHDNLGFRRLKTIDAGSYTEKEFSDNTILFWPTLCQRVFEGREAPDTPEGAVFRHLPAAGRALVEDVAATGVADAAAQRGLVSAFNGLLRDQDFSTCSFWTDYPLQRTVPSLLAKPPADRTQDHVVELNRELLESVFSEAFDPHHIPLDHIVLSDAGAPLDWQARRFEGLITTAMRAVSVTMNRIHSLELEDVDISKCIHVRIDDEAAPGDDAEILNPAVRKRLAEVRTDLNPFSKAEIRTLVMHGYLLSRRQIGGSPLRSQVDPAVFDRRPWDPLPSARASLRSAEAADALKYSKLRKLGPLTASVYGIIALTLMGTLGLSIQLGWWENAYHAVFAPDEVHVSRLVVYSTFLHFEDSIFAPVAGRTGRVGMAGTDLSARDRRIYDETHYTMAYYLKRHNAESMPLHQTASGIGSVVAVIPPRLQFTGDNREEYERVRGTRLDYSIPVEAADATYTNYILLSLDFYNSFQFVEGSGYQSDGGVHIHYPTDELVMVFDFRNLPYDSLIVGQPRGVIRGPGEAPEEMLPVEYVDGVIHSGVIRDLLAGRSVHFYWEWSTERQRLPDR